MRLSPFAALFATLWAASPFAADNSTPDSSPFDISPIPPRADALENPLSIYRAAILNNAGHRAAQSSVVVEQEGHRQAYGQLLPNVSLSGSWSRNQGNRDVSGVEDSYRYTNYAATLNLRQPLFRKELLDQLKLTEARIDSAESRLNQAKTQLSLRAISAYMDTLYAEDQARLLRAQKASIANQLAVAEKSASVGRGTRIDVDDARAKLDLAGAQETEVANLQQTSRRTLESIIARPMGAIAVLQADRMSLNPPEPANLSQWVADAEASNPELQAMKAQITAAEREVDKVQSGHLPTLDLVSSAGRTRNDSVSTQNSQNTNWMLGVQLNVPLYAGGQIDAGVRQAHARLEQIRDQTEEARQNTAIEVRKEYDNVVQGIQRIQALEKASESARQTIESNRKGLIAGQRSTLDVLQAEQQFFSAERDLALARYRFLLAGLRLKGLAGKLNEKDFSAVSEFFAATNVASASNTSPVKVNAAAITPPVPTIVEKKPPAAPIIAAIQAPAIVASTAIALPPEVTAVPPPAQDTAPITAPAPAPAPVASPVPAPTTAVPLTRSVNPISALPEQTQAPAGIYIQIGVFARAENAQKVLNQFSSHAAALKKTISVQPQGNLHRVQIGPYKTLEDAKAAAKQSRAQLGNRVAFLRIQN